MDSAGDHHHFLALVHNQMPQIFAFYSNFTIRPISGTSQVLSVSYMCFKELVLELFLLFHLFFRCEFFNFILDHGSIPDILFQMYLQHFIVCQADFDVFSNREQFDVVAAQTLAKGWNLQYSLETQIITYSIHKSLQILWVSIWLIICKKYTFIFILYLIDERHGVVCPFSFYPFEIKILVLICCEKFDVICDQGVDMPSLLAWIRIYWLLICVTYSRKHSLLIQAPRPVQIPDIHFYSRAWLNIFRDHFVIEPVHQTIWVGILLKVEIIFKIKVVNCFLNLVPFQIWYCQSWKCFDFISWSFFDDSVQIARFKSCIKHYMLFLIQIWRYEQISVKITYLLQFAIFWLYFSCFLLVGDPLLVVVSVFLGIIEVQ